MYHVPGFVLIMELLGSLVCRGKGDKGDMQIIKLTIKIIKIKNEGSKSKSVKKVKGHVRAFRKEMNCS